MVSMLCCPNCGQPLKKTDRTFCCPKRHSFDISASGYCNLLLSSRSGDRVGDEKQMVMARRRFLDRGYYQQLAERGLLSQMIGIDISKSATQYAAKRDARTQYVTASAYQMPIIAHSADLVVSLFAPTPAQEFSRVLRPDGAVLCVVPGEMHLWELKCAVYDTPYRNREEKHRLDGFALTDCTHVEYQVTIDRPEDIRTLFAMTPYSHRTPAEGKRRLEALESLTVTLSFALLTFRPEQGNASD